MGEITAKALPFFDGLSNMAEYSVLLDESIAKSSVSYPFSVMLARCLDGKYDEAQLLMSQIKEKILVDDRYDFKSDDDDVLLMKNLLLLESAIADSSTNKLLAEWKLENIGAYGIKI